MQIALALAAVLLSLCAQAQTLYAVSVRTFSDPSYGGSEGSIYTLNPSTAEMALVAALHSGSTPMGLDGLAIHPQSGVFYGITAPTAKIAPASLVTVDATTGDIQVIGALRHAASDIAFAENGAMFAWLTDSGQLATVDLQTGLATPIGKSLTRARIKGGIAIIGQRHAVIASNGAAGTLDSADLDTGEITTGPRLVNAPYPDVINGLAYSPQGVLYAVNTSFAANSPVDLVKIDMRTGAITRIGPLPTGTDALAFRPHDVGTSPLDWLRRRWRVAALAALFLAAAVLLLIAMRRHPGHR